MVYTTEYLSPLGTITLACDEEAIIGLWFNGQKHFGSILPRQTERQERPLFQDARRWLDVYFSGKIRISRRRCIRAVRRSSRPCGSCFCRYLTDRRPPTARWRIAWPRGRAAHRLSAVR